MIATYYQQYKDLGLSVVPVEWDIEKKEPVSHRFWSDTKELKLFAKHNAIMIKADGDYGCLDFDIKNTDRKTIFDEWKTIVLNQWPEVYSKLYIEETRNKGYHLWLKYPKLKKKLALAESDKGNEVIALYAKGPLIYTFPTPGYTEYSSSMEDVQELTDEEFEYLVSTSQMFNEYHPSYDPNLKAVAYPEGHEYLLSQFDKKLPDEYWQTLLNEVGLKEITGHRYSPKDKFVAYKRQGSDSAGISAKVYFHTKRVMIFSASMHDYPNWHNRQDYPVWCLPPSFLLFYSNNRDWVSTIETIQTIIDSAGIQIDDEPVKISTTFPMHVFPDAVRNSMYEVSLSRSLAPQFLATAALWTVSSLAGTRYISDFNGDGKNILFCLMIAPVSVGKTPSFRAMCETPLNEAYRTEDKNYFDQYAEWEASQEDTSKKKKTIKKPRKFIPIATDGTTESYIAKSVYQKTGIGVYLDEAETIFNAGSFKGTNDAISFFTGAFSGGRTSQMRADETKERVVPNMNLNLLMGTQPSRLKNIFTEDRLSSGFASRFLMVQSEYMMLNIESDPFDTKKEMCQEWIDTVSFLFTEGVNYNNDNCLQTKISITPEGKTLYRKYFRELLLKANDRMTTKAEEYILGTEAKMSAYLPRLIQVTAIIHNPHSPVITEEIVQHGWDLYNYYSASSISIIGALHGEIETGLPKDLELLFQSLPDEFVRKEAAETCTRLNINARRFDISIRRKDFGALFVKLGHGKYRKL